LILDSDEQGNLPLLLEVFDCNDEVEPIVKWHRGPGAVSLEVLQADGTRRSAVSTHIGTLCMFSAK